MKKTTFRLVPRRLRARTWIALALSAGALAAFATGPSWWQSRGVIDLNQTMNDFAAVNIGQLKNMAAKARDEMDANLPGGSSGDIQALVNSFATVTEDRNDFAAPNVGQLKTVAKPFYDRLIQAHYASGYPWDDNDPARNDFAQVNVGQLKNVFNLDFTTDSNQDGLPDWWENGWFGNLNVDGSLDAETGGGDGLTNAEEHILGTNPMQAGQLDASGALGLVVHTKIN